jgi:curved DNA-binding protein CbpA
MTEKESNKREDTGETEKEESKTFPDIPDDFYERLGVSQDASTDEINIAWKKKIGGFHSDKYTDEKQKEEAEEWTKNLNEARQALGDEEKRKKYDEKRKREQEKKKQEGEDRRREEEKNQREQEQRTTDARQAAVAAAGITIEEQNSTAAGDKNGGRGETETDADDTVYDMFSAKQDRNGLFIYREGLKVYLNEPEKDKDGHYMYDKEGKPVWRAPGAQPGTPVNRLWKKQASLLTPNERLYESAPMQIAIKRQKFKESIRSLLGLNENPKKEKEALGEYEALVRSGKAKFMGELAAVKEAPANHPRNTFPDERLYKIMKRRYAKKGSFDDYEFKLIGVYDEEGRFTGKTRLYRIEKAA